MTRQAPHKWTDAEKVFLRDNYLDMSCAEIGEHLGLTQEQVKAAAGRYGIKGKRRPISDEEKKLFIALYPDMNTAELAKKLDRSVSALYGMAEKFGVQKSEAYQAAKRQMERERLRDSGIAHRYSKGNVPPNKGTKGISGMHPNCRKTQFKKGQPGRGWKPIGAERICRKQGYILVKITEGQPLNYRAKHNIIWEQANGPIPKGHVIAFIDRNPLNCVIENLECITRAELMKRNTLHNYPEPVKAQIHALAGFRRKLNRYAKKQDRRSQEHPV